MFRQSGDRYLQSGGSSFMLKSTKIPLLLGGFLLSAFSGCSLGSSGSGQPVSSENGLSESPSSSSEKRMILPFDRKNRRKRILLSLLRKRAIRKKSIFSSMFRCLRGNVGVRKPKATGGIRFRIVRSSRLLPIRPIPSHIGLRRLNILP